MVSINCKNKSLNHYSQSFQESNREVSDQAIPLAKITHHSSFAKLKSLALIMVLTAYYPAE